MEFKQTSTIENTYKRAAAENLGISKNFIKRACYDGKLKHCRVGNKILIYWPNLLEFLKNGDPDVSIPEVQTSVINKIPEKTHRFRLISSKIKF